MTGKGRRKGHPARYRGHPAVNSVSAGGGTDPAVGTAVHLLHRRRGWSWVLASSLAAVGAVAAIGASLRPGVPSAPGILLGITVVLLLALAVTALITVVADTRRLRHQQPAVRTAAADQASHHPVHAHPFRDPVHHRASHAFVWLILSIILLVTAASLPDQVNAYAYTVGAGKSVTFMPQSYSTMCSNNRNGGSKCSTATDGVLETDPPMKVGWPGVVPLNQPFSVREPVWAGWSTPSLMNGYSAATGIGGGLILDLGSALVIWGFVHMLRRRRRSRRAKPSVVPATG
jgi:hypothetical protein